MARFLEETTWTIVNAPINFYNYIQEYYSDLSPIRPSMVRQVAEREGTRVHFGHTYSIDDADSIEEVTQRMDLRNQQTVHSGEFIEKLLPQEVLIKELLLNGCCLYF